MTVHDKANWHSEGEFPADLDPFQAHVHIGMFLGWLVERGLTSEEFREDFAEDLAEFRARTLTGPRLLERADGTLDDEMLSEPGADFAGEYYPDAYVADFTEVLAQNLPTPYHVADTWPNFERLKARLDQRFKAWRLDPE